MEEGDIQPDSYLVIENLDRLTREHVRTATKFFLSLLDLKINIVTTSPEKVYRHDSTDMTDIIVTVVELSRGAGESARKVEMVGKAWRSIKKAAVENKHPVTAQCPGCWLSTNSGQTAARNSVGSGSTDRSPTGSHW